MFSHPPLQLKHDQQSIFDKSDTSTLDFDSGTNDVKNQAPGNLSLEAEATGQIGFLAKELGPLKSLTAWWFPHQFCSGSAII